MERSHLTDADIVKYYEPWPPNCKKVKIYSILTVGFREAVVGWDFEKMCIKLQVKNEASRSRGL